MQRFKGVSIVVAAVLLLYSGTENVSARPLGATSPNLGAAGSYSVLSGAAITNTGATSMPGDVGISPGIGPAPHYSGFGTATIGPPGSIHDADSNAADAQAANTAAFTALDQPCDVSYAGAVKDLTGEDLVAGVYCADAFALSGTLTLSGGGVWIFKSASDLITSGTANVVGGDPCNVWWRQVSSATLGVNTSLIGNVLSSTAIILETGASLEGRAFTQTAAITLDSNTISGAACLTASTASTATPTTGTGTVSGTPTGTDNRDTDNDNDDFSVSGLPETGGGPIRSDFPLGQIIALGFGLVVLALGYRAYRRSS